MSETSSSLVIFTKGALMLAEADTIQRCKELKSLGLTAADWAKRKGMGEKAILYCRSFALEAERKMGQMLNKTPVSTGRPGPGRGKKGVAAGNALSGSPPTAKELGLNRKQRAEARLLAALSQTLFELVKSGEKTKREVFKIVKREKKKREHAAKIKCAVASDFTGPFDLVAADPPWRYEHCEANNREIENHYNTATLEDIFKHKPNAADASVLFLWATAPKIEEAISVMNAWGFSYRSCAVWDKQRMGMGYWWRIQHELLLVGVKGDHGCTPESVRVSSIFTSPRGKHSEKPACVYKWIERAFPDARKLEMYARKPRPGWATSGNEIS
jgi:N6-adenosine-specific RNA methylase IME4